MTGLLERLSLPWDTASCVSTCLMSPGAVHPRIPKLKSHVVLRAARTWPPGCHIVPSSWPCPLASAWAPSAALLISHFPPLDVSHVFPEFPAPDLGSVLLQESITLQDVKALQLAYRRHCEVTAPP